MLLVPDSGKSRLDDAARAGWLYFIAGTTQDEIARKLGVSRATAQRLVSLCISERLITFRLEHPIAACLELEQRLTERFELRYCRVAPSDPASPNATFGPAEAAAAFLETTLRSSVPQIIALGTGRMMRAAVEQIPPMEKCDHQIVSLVGNISPDGSASLFDALHRLADLTKARHFPIPLPAFLSSAEERAQLLQIHPVDRVRALAERADLRLVGVGQMDLAAQLHVDGFISRDELFALQRLGAVGEVIGWAIDRDGNVLDGASNDRVTSIPLQVPSRALVVGVASGPAKVPAILAALRGRILNGLITNEATAVDLLAPG
jgi:DNA-binding transcriptional regulator LsrR (DeoR family)